MIRACLCGKQKNSDLHLGCLVGAFRATPNESSKLTPNLLAIGREVRLPAELVFGSAVAHRHEEITSDGECVDMLRPRLQDAHDIARRHLDSAAKRSKDIYDTALAVNTA